MNRLLVAVAVLLMALSAPTLMPGQVGNAQPEHQVREVCNTLNQALLKGDIATLNRVFADEFTIIRPNGMAVGKAVAVSDVASGKTKFDSIEQLDSKVQIYGNTAVVTTLERVTGQVGGNPFNTQLRNTYVMVRRESQWVVVQRQMTPVATPKPDAPK